MISRGRPRLSTDSQTSRSRKRKPNPRPAKRPNAQAPVFRLPVVEPLETFYWRADFTLVTGEILHDYLA